jgi:hypothetical protein
MVGSTLHNPAGRTAPCSSSVLIIGAHHRCSSSVLIIGP